MSIKLRYQWAVLPFLIFAACSSNGNTADATLTAVTDATAAACPSGGVAIESGIDTNGNGVLDASEVTSTKNVCNGSSGSGSNGDNALVSTTTLPSGDAHCANGGTEVDAGIDNGAGGGTEGDGILQPGEVTSTQYICNGSSGGSGSDGQSSLVATANVPVGDAHCPNGGTEIETGLDNGANGAIANDGILQAGEITATQYVCDGNVSNSQWFVGAMTPPASPVGAFTIDTSGGQSTGGGSGGHGGDVTLYSDVGTLGGHVKIFNTGVVDASFALPTVEFDGGAVLFSVTRDTPLNAYDDQSTAIASGDKAFQINGDDNLYVNLDGVATVVTGIDIAKGVTLTFALEYLTLTHDIRNAGTITSALLPDGVTSGDLYFYFMGNYIGEIGSSISLDGVDAPGDQGGNGGQLNLIHQGVVVNQGSLHAIGGSGDTGGSGGEIQTNPIGSSGGFYNTGIIDTHGGVGAVNGGGASDGIYIYVTDGGVYNSGALITAGGAGVSSGGSAGSIYVEAEIGGIVNSGTISEKGGSCTGVGCNGGGGNGIQLVNYGGGDVLNSGAIDMSGGDGDTASGSGGVAGTLYPYNCDCSATSGSQLQTPIGDIRFSGSIIARGGSGASGGTGGVVNAYLAAERNHLGQEVAFLGYTNVTLDGGSASGSGNQGGASGNLLLQQNYPAGAPGTTEGNAGPAGAALNYADVSVRGGDGAIGGNGGEVLLETQRYVYFNAPFEIAGNYGIVDARGGAATDDNASGGEAGYLELLGISGVQNAGAVTATGGDASGVGSFGGGGNEILFTADYGAVQNTGVLSSNGGNSTGTAGNGGTADEIFMNGIGLTGPGVSNSASISCSGGNGANSGGDGGPIQLFTSFGTRTENTGDLTAAAGSGATNGNPGSIIVDGSNVGP